MSTSKIEWCDSVWNPVVGCSIVSPGCTNCYAMRMAARLEKIGTAPHYAGTTKIVNGNPVWTGKVAMAPDRILLAPLRWKKPRRIFVNSMSDAFHESVQDAWLDRILAVAALCPQHRFLFLTKRAGRMAEYVSHISEPGFGARDRIDNFVLNWTMGDKPRLGAGRLDVSIDGYDACERWPLPNVYLGVSVEDQTRADERIPDLLATPAAVRFVSVEPLLGPVDFRQIRIAGEPHSQTHDALSGYSSDTPFEFVAAGLQDRMSRGRLDWVICGGESGPGARPMAVEWARSLRDQCKAAGVPFFMKQMTKKAPIPDDLMVREFPEGSNQ